MINFASLNPGHNLFDKISESYNVLISGSRGGRNSEPRIERISEAKTSRKLLARCRPVCLHLRPGPPRCLHTLGIEAGCSLSLLLTGDTNLALDTPLFKNATLGSHAKHHNISLSGCFGFVIRLLFHPISRPLTNC